MHQGTIIVLDENLALDAAHYGLVYKLPLADSIIYAKTRKYEAILWTQDSDFKGLESVKYFPKN